MNDKMREAFDQLEQLAQLADANSGLDSADAADLCVAVQNFESALQSQQPESEPIGEIGIGPNGELEPQIYSNFDIDTVEVGTELYISPQPSPQVPEGWEILPDDLRTHLGAFREAVSELFRNSAGDGYWLHELKTIDRIRDQLSSAPSIVEEREWISCAERLPSEVDSDALGDVWCRTVAGETYAHPWSNVVNHTAIYTHWMPTGLTLPIPPAGGE